LWNKKGGYVEIRILGSGCPRCQELEKRTKDVLAELNATADVAKVTDMKKIMEYRIMSTPGLVINGKVKSWGRLPSKDEIRKWIEEESKQ
jgi:small redox-active disulfide protein 2